MFVTTATVGASAMKRTIVFVRFDDEKFLAAVAEIPIPRAHSPPDDSCRLEAGRGKRLRRHYCRRCLSVRAGDTDELVPRRRLCPALRRGESPECQAVARARAPDGPAGPPKSRSLRCAPSTCDGSWPCITLIPMRSRSAAAAVLVSHPVTACPRRANSSASALIPAPAMPTK